jgi:hypothetical protein
MLPGHIDTKGQKDKRNKGTSRGNPEELSKGFSRGKSEGKKRQRNKGTKEQRKMCLERIELSTTNFAG